MRINVFDKMPAEWKRTLFAAAALCSLAACTASGPSADPVRAAVERQLRDYPASTLLDLYKSFFQERFGPGHIVSDTTAAGNYLRRELASADRYAGHYYEPTGCNGGFYRVSLAVIAEGLVPYDLYFDAFMRSVREIEPVEVEQWRSDWQEIVTVIADAAPDLPDFAADSLAIARMLEQGGYASHHSRIYNEKYLPHYRLIRKDIFESELQPLIDRH